MRRPEKEYFKKEHHSRNIGLLAARVGLEKFIKTGLDGISIGSNDLTQLTLDADRDNSNVIDR